MHVQLTRTSTPYMSPVVMIRLLISMFNDTYAAAKKSAEAIWRIERGLYILTMERRMIFSLNYILFWSDYLTEMLSKRLWIGDSWGVWVFMCVCACMHVYMHAYIHACMHVCMCVFMCICMYACMHVYDTYQHLYTYRRCYPKPYLQTLNPKP